MSIPVKPKLASYQSDDTLHSVSTLCASNEKCSPSRSDDNVVASSPKPDPCPKQEVVPLNADTPPDGGLRAWLVLFGLSCACFTGYGYTATWGVFQAYYETTFLRDSSSTQIAWIGSVQYASVFIPNMVVGRLFDKGYHHSLCVTCSAILALATMLVAECKEYWHFLICQGFVTGISCGVVVALNTAIISQWFGKRRPLAFGIAACGSSLGGTMFPIVIRLMIPRLGFQWTMRVLGFLILFFLTITALTARRRLPPTHPTGPLMSFRPLKNRVFVLWCLSTLFVYIGAYIFQAYVASVAVSKGFSDDFSFLLVAVANGSSGVGRATSGLIASYVGSMNTMIPSVSMSALVVMAWSTASTQWSLILISALYGLTSGSYEALLFQPILDIGEPDELSRRIGILFLSLACAGLAGPPVGGEVKRAGGLLAMSIFAGGCRLVGVMIFGNCARYMTLKRMWGKI